MFEIPILCPPLFDPTEVAPFQFCTQILLLDIGRSSSFGLGAQLFPEPDNPGLSPQGSTRSFCNHNSLD